MHIVIVNINVIPDNIKAFIDHTIVNVSHSNREPGVVAFQFIQKKDDPTKFVLYEIYKTEDDQRLHRETVHYQAWKKTVETMMAAPRVGVVYNLLA